MTMGSTLELHVTEISRSPDADARPEGRAYVPRVGLL